MDVGDHARAARPRGNRQGDRRPGRSQARLPRGDAVRRPRAPRRRPRDRQDAHGEGARAAARLSTSSACSAPPTSCPRTSSARTSSACRPARSSCTAARRLPTCCWSTRSTACRRARRRRCSNAWRSARSRSTACATSFAVLHRVRDAEPDRLRRHVPAARGAARSLPREDPRAVSLGRGRDRAPDSCAARIRLARPRHARHHAGRPEAALAGARGRQARHGAGRALRLHRRPRAADARLARARARREPARRGQPDALRQSARCHGRPRLSAARRRESWRARRCCATASS